MLWQPMPRDTLFSIMQVYLSPLWVYTYCVYFSYNYMVIACVTLFISSKTEAVLIVGLVVEWENSIINLTILFNFGPLRTTSRG